MTLKHIDKMVIVLTQMGRFPHASITMWCIRGARFPHASITMWCIRGARFPHASITMWCIRGARFPHASITMWCIRGARFPHASITMWCIKGARFPHASITMWCIKGARNCFTQSHVKSLHCQLLSFLSTMSNGLYIYALKSILSTVLVNGLYNYLTTYLHFLPSSCFPDIIPALLQQSII